MSRPVSDLIETNLDLYAEIQRVKNRLARAGQPIHDQAVLNVAKARLAKKDELAKRHNVQLVNRPFANLLGV
jgi:hypothetical protein